MARGQMVKGQEKSSPTAEPQRKPARPGVQTRAMALWTHGAGVVLLLLATGAASAQSGTESLQAPSRALQLPLSGRGQPAGDVRVQQQTSNAGTPNSVVTTQSTITVQPPYNGSAAHGQATAGVLPLTLDAALKLAFQATSER